MMLTRVAYAAGCFLTLIAAWLFRTPPSPHDTVAVWPVLTVGAAALAIAAVRPVLLSGWLTWIAVAVVTVAGLAIGGLLSGRLDVCCMYTVSERHGYPYSWLNKSADYETLTQNARPATFDGDAVWSVDWPNVLLSGLFWASAAIATVVLLRALILAAGRGRKLAGTQDLHA